MSKRKIFLIIIFSIIFISLVVMFYLNKLYLIDDFAYKYITLFKCDNLTNFFKVVTMCGGFIFSLILSDIVLFFNRKKGLYFFINVFIILGINTVLKYIFVRERPIGINLINENGYSFPSAHSMLTIGLYGLLLFYVYRTKNHSKIAKILSLIIICILMLAIPITRVYLGVHYFSDILAGACLSGIWLMIYSEYLKRKSIM